MSQPNQYEIEMVVKHKTTQAERLITITEWAYDAKDAFNQCVYNHVKHLQVGEAYHRLEYIGPPRELIRSSAYATAQRVVEALDNALKGKKV